MTPLPPTGRDQLDGILSRLPRARIGVIGDFCLDAYWEVEASLSEISVETGLPTRAVKSQRYSPGGASNVAANLVALGVSAVRAFAVLGTDPFAGELRRLLEESLHVDTSGVLVQDDGWNTPVYVKPVEGEIEQNRIDFGNANELSPRVGEKLLAALRASLGELDLVIVNQQLLHGLHTEAFRAGLAPLIATSPVPFVCDSRSFSDSYTGAIRKLNDREALRLVGVTWASLEPVPRPDAERAARMLFDRWKTPVFLTRGSRGMLVQDAAGTHEVPGLQILGRIAR